MSRGKWLTAAGVFDYLFTHIDDLVVGKVLGTGVLGIYQQAYRVATLPTIETEQVFNKVTFPAYITVSGRQQGLSGHFRDDIGYNCLSRNIWRALIIFSRPAIFVSARAQLAGCGTGSSKYS